MQFKKISETEMEIMEVLWGTDHPLATTDLLDYFNKDGGKNWKSQTISTFLTRLSEKGFVAISSNGRGNLHSAVLSHAEYNKLEAQGILRSMYNGSIKNFIATLYSGDDVSNEEISELKKWLDER